MGLKNIEELFVRQPDFYDEHQKDVLRLEKTLDKIILFDKAEGVKMPPLT